VFSRRFARKRSRNATDSTDLIWLERALKLSMLKVELKKIQIEVSEILLEFFAFQNFTLQFEDSDEGLSSLESRIGKRRPGLDACTSLIA
ncbi:hypothetical protein KI387_014922, partial [Taxus chinensis]